MLRLVSDDGTTTEECTDGFPGEGGCDVDDASSSIADDLKAKFRDFKGMAATLRFDDGAIEFEMAGDSNLSGQFLLAAGRLGRGRPDTAGRHRGRLRARLRRRLVRRHHRHVRVVHRGDPRGPDERALRHDRARPAGRRRDPGRRLGCSRAGLGLRPGRVLQLRGRLRHPDRGQDQGRPGRDREGARQAPRDGRPRGERARVGRGRRHDRDRPEQRLPRRRPRRTATWATTTCSRTSCARPTRRRRCCS